MLLSMCKAKLHRLTVTEADLHYEGSITIDEDLLKAAGILPFEKVQIVNINNGERFETYVYAGMSGSRMVCLNGAAARRAQIGDRIIAIAYCDMDADEARHHHPTLVLVGEDNAIKEIIQQDPTPLAHGQPPHQ